MTLRDQVIYTANALDHMVEAGLPPGCQSALAEHARDLLTAVQSEDETEQARRTR